MKHLSLLAILILMSGCRSVSSLGITEPVPWLGISQEDLCENYEEEIKAARKALRGQDYDNYVALDAQKSRIQKYRRLKKEQCDVET